MPYLHTARTAMLVQGSRYGVLAWGSSYSIVAYIQDRENFAFLNKNNRLYT